MLNFCIILGARGRKRARFLGTVHDNLGVVWELGMEQLEELLCFEATDPSVALVDVHEVGRTFK